MGLERQRSVLLLVALLAFPLFGQNSNTSRLSRDQYRSGEEILRSFGPVSTKTRNSIVKFYIDAQTVALGAIINSNGLAVTKASELSRKGKLTCWTADDRHVDAEVIATDDEDDVALVRVQAGGLIPVEWSDDEVHVGQWAVTPGLAKTPQAVGIVSALPHKIRPQRAFIGVEFQFPGTTPKIGKLTPGLGAEKAGLQKGDLIVAVNGDQVTNRMQVVEALREFRQGQVVKLGIEREEKRFDVEIEMMPPAGSLLASELDTLADSERLRGQVSKRAVGFEKAIEHDTVLQPWACGGPLVDLNGKVIGLNIARASRVSTYALPSSLVQRVIKNLQAKRA